jgi:Zn-dependent M16 (insulinase) family peptidase
MDPKDTLFFAEMYSLVRKMEETIDEFEMKDRTVASIVIGLIDIDSVELGESETEMKTMYSFNLQSRSELEAVKEIMDNTYQDDDDDIDLDDLLSGLGISLN